MTTSRAQDEQRPDTLLIDCHHAGISGDMLLGALIDLGADPDKVAEEIDRCTRDFGKVKMKVSKVQRASILCTKVDFEFEEKGHVDMDECLEKASDPWVRDKALKVLHTLEEAEAKVHGSHGHHPHLHEVGRLDAVADILGSLTAWRDLGLDEVRAVSTRVALGGGEVSFSHGRFPVPAPATLEILRGVPTSFGGDRELTTPTGAALLVNLAQEWVEEYGITPIRIGLGAGQDAGNFFNATRVVLGRAQSERGDFVDIIETNVDDVTGETLGHSVERLIKAGALDVSVVPVLMKKGRPGHLIRALAPAGRSDEILELLLAETGSLGARIYRAVERRKLERQIRNVEVLIDGRRYTARGKIGISPGGEVASAKPEYEDVAAISRETGMSFVKIHREILQQIGSLLGSGGSSG